MYYLRSEIKVIPFSLHISYIFIIVRMALEWYVLLFVNIYISQYKVMYIFSYLISKRAKFFLLALLSRNYFYLSDQTGSRFSKPKVVCPIGAHTWTYAV